MELRDIQYFSTIAKHGNLGRAAEALGLSQSALSKSLRRLEHEMGTKLVQRTPKGIELTAEGSALLSRADHLRLSLDDVAREVADVNQGRAGHLRISAGAGWEHHLLPLACERLIELAPNLTLNVRIPPGGQNESLKALRSGEVDVVITVSGEPLAHDLAHEHLYDDEYVVCASANHRLAKKRLVTLADVAHERWTLADPTSAMSRQFHAVFRQHGLSPPHVTLETAPQTLRFRLIASSNLLGYTWGSLVREAMPHLRLAEFRVKELSQRFQVGVAFRKGAYLSPAVLRFMEILKATAKHVGKIGK